MKNKQNPHTVLSQAVIALLLVSFVSISGYAFTPTGDDIDNEAETTLDENDAAVIMDWPWYDRSVVACGPEDMSSIDSSNVVGNGRQEQLFNFVRQQLGLTPEQAAVLVGVTMGESGQELNPLALNSRSKAYGIVQWLGPRKTGVLSYIAQKGKSEKDFASREEYLQFLFTTQMEYLIIELKGSESQSLNVLKKVQSAADIPQGVYNYEAAFERSGHAGISARRKYAKFIYEKYGQNAAPVTPAPGIPTVDQSGGSKGTIPAECCLTPTAESAFDSAPAEWNKMYTGANAPKVARMAKGDLPAENIKALIIHYTTDHMNGQQLLNYFASGADGNNTGVQFHIDLKGNVSQYYPLEDMKMTYHVKGMNSKAIGIEIAGKNANELLTNEAQFQAVVATVKTLCEQYNIPCEDPKGDITGSTAAQAQGLLGHDEAPGNDHGDPDGIGMNLRSDSSKHPYMKKLRTALGYNPTPGKGGGAGTDIKPVTADSNTPGCEDPAGNDPAGNGTAKDPVGQGTNKALALEAVRYATKENPRFRYSYGGGHGSLADLQKMSYEKGIAVDCSGFIRYVIWATYKVDIGSWMTPNPPSKYFKEVSASEVTAGDIAVRPSHVDFVTNNMGGGKIHQFGAHTTKNGIYGGDTTTGAYTKFYRYTGPTNAAN